MSPGEPTGESDQEDVLVLAPTGRDAAVSARVLSEGGVQAAICASMEEFCHRVREGAGAGVIAEEALVPIARDRLVRTLAGQPPWSDFPLVLLIGRTGEPKAGSGTLEETANVTLLERPMKRATLLSAVRVTLRARRRQYEIRDHLLERERTAAIVESSFDAIHSRSIDGKITTWNAAAERMFGYTAAEAIGRDAAILIPPEQLDELPAIRETLEKGELFAPFETVRLSKNGQRLDVSITVSPLRNADGSLRGASVITRDISERRRAEEHQKLLLAELSHRVKNTLAVVTAIATQSLSHSESMADFGRSFRGRIQALAAAHGLLTTVNWRATQLKALVEQALGPYLADDGANVEIRGDTVLLQPNHALTLSLVLHELTTNAAKYGALQKPGGRVAVDWAVRSDDPRELHLRWTETGGPPPVPPIRRGFGINLIERSVAYELDGRATLNYRAEGLSCEIAIPLPPTVAAFPAAAPADG